MTTYIKWVNLVPEIKDHLINIFRRYTHVLDAELQQRACEYLALAERDDDDELLQIVCDEMPVFPERESALVNRLHQRGDKAQDKRTWVIGQSAENKGRVAEKFKNFRKLSTAPESPLDENPVPPPKPQPTIVVPPQMTESRSATMEPMMGTNSAQVSDDIMSSLAGLDMSTPQNEQPLLPGNGTLSAEPDIMTPISPSARDGPTLGGVNPALLAPLTVAPNVEKWLEKLSYANEGVLYEDKQIQIGIKAEYHGSQGRIALFIGNKISTPFTSISARLENPNGEALDIKFHDSTLSEIQPLAQIQEMVVVECRDVFTEPPVLRYTYLAGGFTTLALRLPIFLSRFVEGVDFTAAAFFERWKIIGGELRAE